MTAVQLPASLRLLTDTSDAVTSLIVLAVILAVFAAIYGLLRVSRPRWALPGRSIDLDAYIKDELFPQLHAAAKGLAHNHGLPAARAFLKAGITPGNMRDFYMRYDEHTSLAKQQQGAAGAVSTTKDQAVLVARMRKVRALALAVGTSQLPKGKEQALEGDADRVRAHLLLNVYRPSLVNMFDARYRTHDLMGLLRLYLGDLAVTVLNVKIRKETWGNFWPELHQVERLFTRWYDSKAGFVKSLPMRLVRGDVDQAEVEADAGVAEEEQQAGEEHFSLFGFLLRPLNAIKNFFQDIGKAIPHIFQLVWGVLKLVTQPEVMIMRLLGLVVGVLVLVLYMIGKALLSLVALLVAGAIIYAMNGIITACWLGVLVAAAAVVLVLWVADVITRGQVVGPALRCEEHPDAWMVQPGWTEGNRVQRVPGLAGFCARPCPLGWMPWLGGVACRRLGGDPTIDGVGPAPRWCPQQRAIYRHLVHKHKRAVSKAAGPDPGRTNNNSKPARECYESLDSMQALTLAACSSPDASPEVLAECRAAFCKWRLLSGQRVVAADAAETAAAYPAFCKVQDGAAEEAAAPTKSTLRRMVLGLSACAISMSVLGGVLLTV